jgi:hypothetical protein
MKLYLSRDIIALSRSKIGDEYALADRKRKRELDRLERLSAKRRKEAKPIVELFNELRQSQLKVRQIKSAESSKNLKGYNNENAVSDEEIYHDQGSRSFNISKAPEKKINAKRGTSSKTNKKSKIPLPPPIDSSECEWI